MRRTESGACPNTDECIRPLQELKTWRLLDWSNLTGENLCLEVVLAAHRSARHPPEHRDLAYVRKRVRDGSLEESLG